MKKVNNIFEKVVTPENFRIAYELAKRGKRNSYGVRKFERNLENNLEALRQSLINNTYRTGTYHIFVKYTPKERIIYRLHFPHRVVHHALMNILEPIWVSVFTKDTYSCIKGRGIHGTVRAVKSALKDKENTQYCLKLDISKFYPSIDHEVLKSILRRKIKDQRVLKILDEVIDSAPGVPIGNYLSQYFANLYLAYFDHFIKEDKGIKYYFRYADDIVILHSDKEFLHSLFKDISQYLFDNLKLTVKSNWQVYPVSSRGVDFVGYVFFHTHTMLRKSIKKAFVAKRDILKSVASYWGWAKHCDSKNLINKIIKKEHYDLFTRKTTKVGTSRPVAVAF